MSNKAPQLESLYYGDCLEVMRGWPEGCVDLCYLDPPFNSKANYNQTFGKGNGVPAQVRAFTDTWTWNDAAGGRYEQLIKAVNHPAHSAIKGLKQIIGKCGMLAYLTYMAQRLAEIKRVLKQDGSVYLHCDPSASHYLKILMDAIFGPDNFRNEIIWRIGWVSGYKTQKKGWIRNHDTILYYVCGPEAKSKFNKEYLPYPEGYVRRDGKKPTGKGFPIEDTWNCSSADILDSIMIKSFSPEKLGYDTQKTIKLLKRIIEASSNEGDVVLDPFCGTGTTLVAAAAEELKRKWVGIDISPRAIEIIKKRMNKPSIPTFGIPTDMEGARLMLANNPFDFEAWAVTSVQGLAPNETRGNDKGIDGRGCIFNKIEGETGLVLAQVKGGGYTASALRDFFHVLDQNKATAGIFITMEPTLTKAAKANAAARGTFRVGGSDYPRVQFWSIRDMLEGKRYPALPALADPDTGKPVQEELSLV